MLVEIQSVEFLVKNPPWNKKPPPCFATDFLGREAAKETFRDLGAFLNPPIELLIRLDFETGTMRILRGEGGVGGGSGPYSAWQEKSEIQTE